MSKCERASVIIPMLFQCQLKLNHVQQAYKDGLDVQLSKQDFQLFHVDLIVSTFGKLTKSNTLISSSILFSEDRRTFHDQIINARQSILTLMNAADYKMKKSEK